MFQPLDGPSLQNVISVNDTTKTELKIGSFAYSERKVVTIQPLGGKIRVFFADSGSTPTDNDVLTKGFIQFKYQLHSYEIGEKQIVYIMAETGTFNVVVAERS